MLDRIERDEIGEMNIPLNAYYGIASLRSKENFSITKVKVHKQMIRSLAIVKKSCCLANFDANYLSKEVTHAICRACDEVMNGRFNNQFITDAIQGGAGLAMNMNMNEVIANRANEIMGGKLGEYNFVHPLREVNLFQSTNDVIPTSAKYTILTMAKPLITELKKLQRCFLEKASQNKGVIKMGRTHLQDSLPISVEQQFKAIAATLLRDIDRLNSSLSEMLVVNLGTGAVGVDQYSSDAYVKSIIKRLNESTAHEFKRPDNILDNTRNLDSFVNVSHALKLMAINLSKTASDIRLMASGPTSGLNEIILPQVESCSGLLTGKNNPTIAEVVNQVCFQVIGKDATITMAAEHGQLEFNPFGPIIFPNIFDCLEYLTRSLKVFREHTVEGMVINKQYCGDIILNSSGAAVALLPHIGINKTIDVITKARETGQSVRDVVLDFGYLTERKVDNVLTLDKIRKL